MQSLIVKVFLAYWFAAGIVIFITDFGVHSPIHTPELTAALDASLTMHGRNLIHAYQSGTCASMLSTIDSSVSSLYLATPDGRILCGDPQQQGMDKLIAHTVAARKLLTISDGLFRLIAVPITGLDGKSYVVIVKDRNRSSRHVPGHTSLAISGVVTFFLAILIALPIRRLRRATHQIAAGNLEARVSPGVFSRFVAKLHIHDDIDVLMNDFNAMAERLQSLVAAQRLLLRDVSHELRSPLARLAVALELARDNGSGTYQVHLDRIERESVRLNYLIGQILAFSYVESISKPRQLVNLSLRSLIQDLLPDIQFEAESRSCRIVTNVKRDAVVSGDADMLQHALENIVRNAIRYTPPNGIVEIDIDTTELDGHSMAVLRVADNGPGVSEEQLQHILNPFYRAEESRRGTTSGFGIGLAIADRAAHLHSGKIVARNRKGGGLIVEIVLPSLSTAAGAGEQAPDRNARTPQFLL